ncbi:MAG: peptidoglycan-binding protein [Cyanobacteria bacterium Co-bin8]|nr:peptidoglycan-binding protein [Cyanobacteria bacterium Co-bin8]
MLDPGTQSDDVRLLQRQLQQLGHYQGALDGNYGPATRRAVEAFQQQADLPATGTLDRQTWAQMQVPQLWPNPSAGEANAAPASAPAPEGSSSANLLANSANTSSQPADTTPTSLAPTAPVPASAADSSATLEQPASSAPTAPSAGDQDRSLWRILALLSLLMVLTSSVFLALFIWQRTSKKAAGQTEVEAEGDDFTTSKAEASPDYRQSQTRELRSVQSGLVESTSSQVVDVSGTVVDGASAAEATTRLARVNISDELVEALHSPDASIRCKAIWELGQRGNSNAVPALVETMIDADSKERSLILAALSEIGVRTLKPMNQALALSLQDENPEVRKNAIRDLMRVYDLVGQLSQMLGRAAQDHDSEVQETAQWALSQLGRIRQLAGPAYPVVQEAQETALPEDTSHSLPS